MGYEMGKKKNKKPRELPEALGLPTGGVETHAHLDMEPFAEDLDAVLDRAEACGVARIGQVFLGPEAYEKGRGLFESRPGVFFLLGVHPHDAKGWTDETLSAMRAAFASDSRLKAVGEAGLDYYYDYSPRDVQRRVFAAQLQLACEVDRPMVVHSRDALDETFEVLEAEGFKDRPLLWHCFGGDTAFARRVLDNGWMISIPGAVTWKKMDELREAVEMIPMDRLVLETDCPFLAPDPWRGKRNEPAFIGFTARAVAEAKGLPLEEIWRVTAENATRFFRLDEE
ncbi:hydrolase, TatD family [Desulfovibrio ferrophilus]|uniref:Hydrolase, TatD family n=2 Tax=Desulfovibrio ferrophilus TaxID=241368 RepID=A0A2Z6AZX3_9BACT|nr:hydrolase, TatD family [Desulfovibrio ferrophilus]